MSSVKNLLKEIDTDDVKVVITVGSELIKAGMDILETLKDKRNYSLSELMDLTNESVKARETAQTLLHEYIKKRLSES